VTRRCMVAFKALLVGGSAAVRPSGCTGNTWMVRRGVEGRRLLSLSLCLSLCAFMSLCISFHVLYAR
jgi:hypothetical protein